MADRGFSGFLRAVPFLGYHHLFLLAGCSSSSPMIPDIFLISLYYQPYTPVPSTSQTDYNVHTAISNIVGQARLAARVGYFGICINPDEARGYAVTMPLHWQTNQFKDMIVFPYLIIIAIIFAFICLLLLATFPGWHEEEDALGSEREVKPFPSRPVSQVALCHYLHCINFRSRLRPMATYSFGSRIHYSPRSWEWECKKWCG
ncbi:hypothetical protein EYC84_008694 [Monilinia fructicola]|uniref:Uncharacterized protein n=1 Tax=Monilinia fructicola TaxID=38448 RepID=A0A5M9JBW1_MONFR|nr:hypothetical protein EYC84_008694 [Monilinia fructicola]